MDLILPFKIGDLAEARSFIKGYRGAWFRCKVNDMLVKKTGYLDYYLDYIDYPGDKSKWIRVFQKNPAFGKQNNASREIMLRPSFPDWYQGDQVPEHFPKNSRISCVCDTWKVGDLVDWFTQGCYWTGNIASLLSEDKVKIELLKPPEGEGGELYDAHCQDLRPALDWCLENGWTAPLSQANGNRWYTARLIHHKYDAENSSSDEETGTDNDKEVSLKRTSNMNHAVTDDDGEEIRMSLKRISNMNQEATDYNREEVQKSLKRTSNMNQEATDYDREEVRKSLKRTSNMNQEGPGSSNLEVSSDPNVISCQNNQTDTIVTTMGILSPGSTSELSNPCRGAQAAVAQPGTQVTSKKQASPTERVSALPSESAEDFIENLESLSSRTEEGRYALKTVLARSARLTHSSSGRYNMKSEPN